MYLRLEAAGLKRRSEALANAPATRQQRIVPGREAQHAARLSDERPFSGGAATIENDSIAAHLIMTGV